MGLVLPAFEGLRNQLGDMSTSLTVLGIESSCDDTAASIVCGHPSQPGEILSDVVWGQSELHAAFGGVVPEIAARAHAEKLDVCVEEALFQASLDLSDVDAIAVTAGPGLIGGVLSGVMCAKGLAAGAGKPLIAVNHLAGHALTPRLTDGIAFPYLVLLVSGGHCQFLKVEDWNRFTRLGGTIDDAPGEAFDKSAKLLGLGYPGGPIVEKEAKKGDPGRFPLPRPLLDRDDCDMSFSGLKTALRRQRDALLTEDGGLFARDVSNLCASFQGAVVDVLTHKSKRALSVAGPVTAFAVAGGVSANQAIREGLESAALNAEVPLLAPPLKLCTDNGAMIAWAGLEAFAKAQRDGFDFAARPRWPLDQRAKPMIGSGKKGAKA